MQIAKRIRWNGMKEDYSSFQGVNQSQGAPKDRKNSG